MADGFVEFSERKSRTLARISAYSLLLVFLISTVAAALPFGFGDPGRVLALLNELLERSTLPLVSVFLLFLGLAGDALPAVWECRLARALRPLLRLAALLYILAAIAVVGIAPRQEAVQVENLSGQLERSLQGVAVLRAGIERAPDAPTLARLLGSQPGLRQAFEAEAGIDSGAPLDRQRQQALQLIDRIEANLRRQGQVQRSTVAFGFARQSGRLALTAFVYALFFLLAAQIWPRSVAATLERVRQARAARLAEEEAEDEETAAAEPTQ